MTSLSPARLLAACEAGTDASPVARALLLLAAADPGADAAALAALPVGERDARLLALRATLLGEEARAVADCPRCATRVEFAWPVRAALPAAPAEDAIALAIGEATVHLRRITSADLVAVADDPTPARLVARVVARIDGAVPPVDEWWRDAALALERADPAARLDLALACPACAHAWDAPCDVAAFVWDEVVQWADATLRAVHRLASAYGWSEAAILALPPARRRRYLELVGA